jgi:hypothetical protein
VAPVVRLVTTSSYYYLFVAPVVRLVTTPSYYYLFVALDPEVVMITNPNLTVFNYTHRVKLIKSSRDREITFKRRDKYTLRFLFFALDTDMITKLDEAMFFFYLIPNIPRSVDDCLKYLIQF